MEMVNYITLIILALTILVVLFAMSLINRNVKFIKSTQEQLTKDKEDIERNQKQLNKEFETLYEIISRFESREILKDINPKKERDKE